MHEVDRWRDLIAVVCARHRPFIVPVHVEIEYTFGDAKRRDADNHAPKFMLDAFIGRVLLDDDFEHVLTLTIGRAEAGRLPGTRVWFKPAVDGPATGLDD